MIINLLKLACVGFAGIAVGLTIAGLYVMNEMRRELKKDRGC